MCATTEFHWVTARGYISVVVCPLSIRDRDRNNNFFAEILSNNNNKAKTKQQTQEQLSSPLSQILKNYDFGNFENYELNTEII